MASAPTAHGGLLDAELARLGVGADEVVDFSVNVNPYGPSDAVVRAIRGASLTRYPDPTGRAARAAMAATLGRREGELALGHGAVELLWSLARLLVPAGAACVVVGPTFSELGAAVRAGGGHVIEHRARAEDDFAVDLDAVSALVRTTTARAVYLCNPGNPTGHAVPTDEVARLAARHPEVTLVLDQAFLSLGERHADARADLPANVVAVRSLTKDHALAGLRIGYLLAAEALVSRLEAIRPPWMTSGPAQAAAVAAVAAHGFVAESRARMRADRDALAAGLRRLGLRPHPSAAPYLLVPVGRATELRARLFARHRVVVRDATSFGLPDHVRLAARPAADLARLLSALAQELRP